MEKQQNYFYGFIAGFILMIIPIYPFFFWRDVTNVVEDVFRYGGFILLTICGIPLIAGVLRNFRK
ncbi:hypothetical protein GCM10008967_32410 [Bacillus carboniphilus]|uniref:Uncharacterized protein n=1 Tax=Bacillus carboniphilus TaxID=86663 RepID=A0ABP3G8N9_9BACI